MMEKVFGAVKYVLELPMAIAFAILLYGWVEPKITHEFLHARHHVLCWRCWKRSLT